MFETPIYSTYIVELYTYHAQIVVLLARGEVHKLFNTIHFPPKAESCV